jgi:hypothetical protein
MATHGKEAFIKALSEIDQAISLCLEQKLFTATLLLIYSLMDSFYWIEFRNTQENKKEKFEAWVNKWVLPHNQVFCSAVDLYAGRSALLHRLGTNSRLSESGEARVIAWSHGDVPFEGLENMREEYRKKADKDMPIVRLESLVEAVRKGIKNFLNHAENTPELNEKMSEYFDNEQPYRF